MHYLNQKTKINPWQCKKSGTKAQKYIYKIQAFRHAGSKNVSFFIKKGFSLIGPNEESGRDFTYFSKIFTDSGSGSSLHRFRCPGLRF